MENISIPVEKTKKTPNNYIDNKKFYEAMVVYKEQVEEYIRQKQLYGVPNIDKPRINNYIGECLLLIAKNLSKAGNFSSYTYIHDMQSDGIENCLKYIDNFDPTRKNPFAYFTTIMYYAFIRRIAIEKKEQYVKYKNLENFLLSDQITGMTSVDMSTVDNDMTNQIIKNYEEYMQKKKNPAKGGKKKT